MKITFIDGKYFWSPGLIHECVAAGRQAWWGMFDNGSVRAARHPRVCQRWKSFVAYQYGNVNH